jgi:hypothetical protein
MDYGLGVEGSILGRGKIFVFSISPRPALECTQPPIQRVPGVLFTGIKRPRYEANHSLSSSAEVKNGEAITPLLHISSWHGA